MPTIAFKSVKDLNLDLCNYRTVPQLNEVAAVQAMVSVQPDYFWALVESILDSGYLITDNIIVLESDTSPVVLTVKEGNRRIAALKLILGVLPQSVVTMPPAILARINGLSNEWLTSNEVVPCTVYPHTDSLIVDRIIDLAHGKGEKAGRSQWTAVARARHNRDRRQSSQPDLDLLEKYLREGKNRTAQLSEKWAGDYPITVLDEAMPKLAQRLGLQGPSDLAQKYPNIAYRDSLESVLYNIGDGRIGFPQIRDASKDYAAQYGLPPVPNQGKNGGEASQGNANGQANTGAGATPGGDGSVPGAGGSDSGAGGGTGKSSGGTGGKGSAGSTQGGASNGSTGKKTKAVRMDDPRTVMRLLRSLKPPGTNRAKVVTLRDEMLHLKLERNPIAFCFLLRSMFEISAKAYCDDNKGNGGPSMTKEGQDRKLVNVLRDVTKHLTQNNQDMGMVKKLHGAMTELGKEDSVLSVTSMNNLVHNPSFSVKPSDISVMFGNVFPLLEAMNQ